MINIYSKPDNMHKIGMFNALIYINNQRISYINCMLSSRRLVINLCVCARVGVLKPFHLFMSLVITFSLEINDLYLDY